MSRIQIMEYNLPDFIVKVQDAVIDGYRVSDTRDDYPQQIGIVFSVGLVKEESEGTGEAVSKRGRKPKE